MPITLFCADDEPALRAEPFSSLSDFVVEVRQQVEVRGVVLANARMGKALP